jgi:hypothetical protein
LCPFVFARSVGREASVKLDAGPLLVAAALDGVLLYNMKVQEPGYVAMARDVAPSLVSSWLLLWIGWQLVALAVFSRSMWRSRAVRPDVG